MLRRLKQRLGLVKSPVPGDAPTIVARQHHSISRKSLSPNVLKVLYRLNKAGFDAYVVGGCVRDVLLNRTPKDFDVATSARPEQVRALFRNCRLIGRRFRLAHVYFGPEIIEVATLRASHQESARSTHSEEGMILQDNVYGTLEEDAWRRDFSINALYYNIADFSLIDYTGALADLKAKRLRIIGDPEKRFREDPVRILRAIRFSAALNMPIEKQTEAAIKPCINLLENVSSARLFDELVKLFHSGGGVKVWALFKKYHIFEQFFEQTAASLAKQPGSEALIVSVLENTDQRVQEGKPVTPAFVIASLLWKPLDFTWQMLQKKGMKRYPALLEASEIVLARQLQAIAIPNRILQAIRETWILQLRLEERRRNKVGRIIIESRFRAAYDFLLLRVQAGEPVEAAAKWWTDYLEAPATQKRALMETLGGPAHRRRHHGRKRRQQKRSGNDAE